MVQNREQRTAIIKSSSFTRHTVDVVCGLAHVAPRVAHVVVKNQ